MSASADCPSDFSLSFQIELKSNGENDRKSGGFKCLELYIISTSVVRSINRPQNIDSRLSDGTNCHIFQTVLIFNLIRKLQKYKNTFLFHNKISLWIYILLISLVSSKCFSKRRKENLSLF